MTVSRQSTRLPRATCPSCGRDVALRRGGELREHVRDPNDELAPGVKCPGSGHTIAYVERAIDAELEGLRRMSQ